MNTTAQKTCWFNHSNYLPTFLQCAQSSVHRDMFCFVVEELEKPAQNPEPLNTFGMIWTVDCAPGLFAPVPDLPNALIAE